MAVALQTPQGRGGVVGAATTPPPPFYHDLSVLVIFIACKCPQDPATARARTYALSQQGWLCLKSVLIVSGVLIFAAAKVMAIKHYVNVSITIND